LLTALAITAAAVFLAMGMTVLASIGMPADVQLHAVRIAACIAFVIGLIFSYWFVDSFRAMVHMKDAVDRLARTDELTGLDNRRALLAGAEREAARAKRQSDALALLIIDLDDFKRVNDTHGHCVGDLVLVAIADVLCRSARTGVDIVGRLGGEEFAVLLPHCDEAAALQTAERIRAAIEAERVATPAGEIAVTASIGCAAITAGEGVAAAFQEADEALYAAKRGGRNRVAAGAARNRPSDHRERGDGPRRGSTAHEPLRRSA
jgi:diguanylate cyclase (GGDEF)-like protein